MKKMQKLSIIAIAAILTACGGGGGSSDGTETPDNGKPSVPQVPDTGNSDYPSEIPPSNYTNDEQKSVYDTLNHYRTTCGFSSIKQNSMLDVAATGHALYSQTNSLIEHNQNNTNSNYTGRTFGERIQNSGYQYSASAEILAGWMGGTQHGGTITNGIEYPNDAPTGYALINRLFSTVYHLQRGLGEWTDMGIGYSVSENRTNAPGHTSYFAVNVVNFANPVGTDAPEYKGNEIRSFPCDGISGVSPIFTAENPNPFPTVDFSMNPMGTPIYFQGLPNSNFKVNRVIIKDAQANVEVTASLITSLTDVNKMLKPNEVFVVPTNPLKPKTEYSVTLEGFTDSSPVNKTFTFKTGTQN